MKRTATTVRTPRGQWLMQIEEHILTHGWPERSVEGNLKIHDEYFIKVFCDFEHVTTICVHIYFIFNDIVTIA